MIKCNKDCKKCKHLNARVDNKAQPFAYDCMKFGDSVFDSEFKNTKEFKTKEDYQNDNKI